MTPTCSCSRPITDHAFLCRDCTTTLERQLGDIPALAADLEVTRTRQARIGSQPLGIIVRSSETPIPWNDRASRALARFRATLVGWVRVCEDWRVTPEGPACRVCQHPTCATVRATRAPDDTWQGMSAYLLAALPAFRHRPEVTACADDLDAATKAVESVVDRRPELTFYGPCGSVDYADDLPVPGSVPCPADLFGDKEATEVVCEVCAAVHKVSDVREFLVKAAQDRLATAVELSKFLTLYGEPLTAERIRKWAERGQLASHGRNAAGSPLYRVSEAVARLTEQQHKRAS